MGSKDFTFHLPTLSFLVTEQDLQQMHQAALEIIATIGLEVQNEQWRARLEKAGGRLSVNRVMFPQEMVEEFLREWRDLFGYPEPGWGPTPRPPSRPESINASADVWALEHVDLETDEIRPLTCQDLIRYIQFVNQFERENVLPSTPGCPQDVPGTLQPIAQYKISAQYSPAGGVYVWLYPPETAAFLFRMADLMGKPIETLAIFNPTPLRLGGVELEVVFAFPSQFKSLWVSTCIVAGSVGPVYPKASVALGIAENIAAAMAVRILAGLPVDWMLRVDAFDLRSTNTIYGSPEQILVHRLSAEVNAYYRGHFPLSGGCCLWTTAKLPGIQAAAEKAITAGYAVAQGCSHMTGLGSVYMDEVFSPEQFIIDLEIRDWAQRLARGIEAKSERPEEWVEMIRQGVEAGNFLTSDQTLDHYREVYWLPKLFDRSLLAAWQQKPGEDIRTRAKKTARERMVEHPYRLPEPKWSQLEEIYAEAERKLWSG